MMKNKVQIRAVMFTALLVFQILLASPSTAQDLSVLQRDSTITNLAMNCPVSEVRDAITKAREGAFTEAIPTLKKFASTKNYDAAYVLARLYQYGFGVEKSDQAAERILAENSQGQHGLSMLLLAQLKEASEPALALDLYKRSATAGQTIAWIKLGSLAENGKLGLRANPKLAHSHYAKAAAAGIPAGDFQLARCYDVGIGVSPNAIKSTRLFRKAAMGGYGPANAIMARRYFDGKGVEADAVAAVGWLTRGAQAGSSEAMVLLGQRFELGDSVGRDLNRAGQLYSAAAKMGDAAGNYRLAMLYRNGVGTNPDLVRAFVLLNAAKALPVAEQELARLSKELTPEQIAVAKQKIAEAANR